MSMQAEKEGLFDNYSSKENGSAEQKRHNDLLSQLSEETVRIDTLIHIGMSINDGDAMADPLLDFWNDEDEEVIDAVFPDCIAECPCSEVWEFAEYLFSNNKLGFLAKVATPVMRVDKTTRSTQFSWGHYIVSWVYGETLEEVAEKGLAWAAKIREEESK